jgi:hypothetical protein
LPSGGESPDFVYDEEQDLFRFPQDSRFAFSREWAAKHEDITAVRGFAAGSVICWWTQRG